MIPDITELKFPKIDGKQYATLSHADVTQEDMGEKSVTTQVKIDGDIVPDFSSDWEVVFQGEKYIMPLRLPQGAKGNDSLSSTVDLTFQHWAIYQLKRFNFTTIQQIAAGTYLPDEEVATVSLNLGDFCALLGQVLELYYGNQISIDLNPDWEYDTTATVITISHTKIWNVLIESLYDKYGVRWEIKAAATNSNTVKGGERYVIRVGYPTTEVSHVFAYGFEGGLMKIERQIQSEDIRNVLNGRGGETNVPFRYFKNTDPNNPDFAADPDWVKELENIYFTNLMPATFRSYVQGWKAQHINQTDADGKKIYAGYIAIGESNAYSPWAYRKGFTDTKFRPVEFVADEITLNPAADDRQVEIIPGFSPYVVKDSSLDRYGPLVDTLENNDDIYPTLQGTGLDIAVDVEQVLTDVTADDSDAESEIVQIAGAQVSVTLKKGERKTVKTVAVPFTVPAGKTANLLIDAGTPLVNATYVTVESYAIRVYTAFGQERAASGIPAGSYTYLLEFTVHNTDTENSRVTSLGVRNYADMEVATIRETTKNTFDIWVRNIWGSTKKAGESDAQYAERVWKPVLGDRTGNSAKVVFTSGMLAMSEDYEFVITAYPVLDTSKTYTPKDSQGNAPTDENGNVITYASHWRITLAKSDAEMEATGLYVPSTQKQGKAGDTFVFIGTEMTHVPYVVDAEIRLDDWKKDSLAEVKEIKPTFVVTTDRVRLNNEGKSGALINQLRVGNAIRLADKRFVSPLYGSDYETLYIQSITYKYREPSSEDAALNPDVEIVLGNEYAVTANPVATIQGEVSALQRQIGSMSNVEQIVRNTGDRRYLRKDGTADTSNSPTRFSQQVSSADFQEGQRGWRLGKDGENFAVSEADEGVFRRRVRTRDMLLGGGMDVGNYAPGSAGGTFYVDDNGEAHIETAFLTVNKKLMVKELEIQRQKWVGGSQISSPAGAVIGKVEEVYGTGQTATQIIAYRCYFLATDSDGNKIHNEFTTNDLVRCETFNLMRDASGMLQNRYYWRRVLGVSDEANPVVDDNGDSWHYIFLLNISGGYDPASNCAPAPGDHVITLGNLTDTSRQNAIIIASYGAGAPYIYQLAGIDSFTTAGKIKTRISPNGNEFTGSFKLEAGGQTVGDVGEMIQTNSDAIASLNVTADGIVANVGKISRNLAKPQAEVWEAEVGDWGFTDEVGLGAFYGELRDYLPDGTTDIVFSREIDASLFKPDTDYTLTFYSKWYPPFDDPDPMPSDSHAWAMIRSADGASVMAQLSADEVDTLGWGVRIKHTITLHTAHSWVAQNQRLRIGFYVGDDFAGMYDIVQLDIEEIKLEKGTFATPFVPDSEDVESTISQQAEQINLSVKVDGKERAGLTLDAEEGITMQADKVQIKNGDSVAALFTGGILNADLINVGKLTTIVGGAKRITISEFDDAFIRFYHDDGITLACKMGLENVVLDNQLGTLTPNKESSNAIDNPIINPKLGKPAIIQVFNESGTLKWVLFLDGPVTPDEQTYSWVSVALVAPNSATQAQIESTAALKATEYWQFKVKGTGSEPYQSQNNKFFVKKLADAEFSSAASYYVPDGRYYYPSTQMAPTVIGGAVVYRRYYYQISNGVATRSYITVS